MTSIWGKAGNLSRALTSPSPSIPISIPHQGQDETSDAHPNQDQKAVNHNHHHVMSEFTIIYVSTAILHENLGWLTIFTHCCHSSDELPSDRQTARQTDRQTDTSLMASFPGKTWVSWHQKSRAKTILNFNEARDDGVAVASARPHANHLHLTPDRQPCRHLIKFLQATCSSWR